MNKILHPDGKTPAIYFPPGLPERKGSCAFASMRCLVNCLSYLTHNSVTDDTFAFFKEKTVKQIVSALSKEVARRRPKLIEWFCWGDCPPDMTAKVLEVMIKLSRKGIVQCGFTRNRALWGDALTIKNMRLGFTTEDEDELEDLAKLGLVAYPQYDSGETELYFGNTRRRRLSGCGSSFMYTDESKKIAYDADCSECYKNKRGCFTKFKFQDC